MIYGLPEKLRLLRIQHKYSQQELANKLHVAPATISAYESGERTPSLENFLSIANLYHVSADYLLGLNPQTRQAKLNTSHLNKNQLIALQALIDTME